MPGYVEQEEDPTQREIQDMKDKRQSEGIRSGSGSVAFGGFLWVCVGCFGGCLVLCGMCWCVFYGCVPVASEFGR